MLIDYPWYYAPLCLLLGAVYSAFLYFFRRKPSASQPIKTSVAILLALLRMLAVAAIAFLFLSPLFKQESSRKEKPIVIIAEDRSKSLDICDDSAFYANEFASEMDRLASNLGKNYDVQRITYGGNTTDMAEPLNSIAEQYYRRNVGAVIMTGDGIYNSGQNPLNVASGLSFPVYTVAMGDTTTRRDACISHVRFNRIAFLGNRFPIDVTVSAKALNNESSILTVSCDGKQLFSKPIRFEGNHFACTESVTLDASRAGSCHYVVEIKALDNELTLLNNRQAITIEVIDGRQRVAIVSAAPHPDVAALKRALESNQNYEVETFLSTEFKPIDSKSKSPFDLLILHQLPSKNGDGTIDLKAILDSGVPALFVIGSQTDLPRLNALHTGLEIHSRLDRQNEVSALPCDDFTFFTLPEQVSKRIERFPPLVSPFGEYRLSGNGQTLFKSKIGTINSGLPLVAATSQGNRRYAFVTGEGLWRWRLADFEANQTHDDFDQLVNKLVNFTALRVNKEQFHVEAKNTYDETEEVVLEAELYDDNYEPVNTPDAEITVSSKQPGTTSKTVLFNRTGTGYRLNMGTLPPGSYYYSAHTQLNGKNFTVSGSFVIDELHTEALNLIADHSLMATLAATTGGQMVEAHDLEQIEEMLRSRDDMKTSIYKETTYSDMLNMPLIFIIILLLLTAEWGFRKWLGEI